MVVEAHGQAEEFPREIGEGGRWRLVRKIGEGSFGTIFMAIDRHRGEHSRVAVKFEHRKCPAPQLRDEYRTYQSLKGLTGIPVAHWFGQEGAYQCLVMDLLGCSLEELFEANGRRFQVSVVAQFGIQMVNSVFF